MIRQFRTSVLVSLIFSIFSALRGPSNMQISSSIRLEPSTTATRLFDNRNAATYNTLCSLIFETLDDYDFSSLS